MKNPMDQNHLIKLSQQLWASNFPKKLFPQKVKYDFGAEHHNILVGNNEKWEAMIRFSINEDLLWEANLLNSILKTSCPVLIPKPLFIASKSENISPYKSCVIYEPINGEPLYKWLIQANQTSQLKLAKSIGHFIKWLNTAPIPKNFVPINNKLNQDMISKKELNYKRLTKSGLPPEKANEILSVLYSTIGGQKNSNIIHNDFYPQHILVTSNQKLGIIDWADITFGDPIKDLTFLFEVFEGPEVYQDKYHVFTKAVLSCYRPGFPDSEELRRLKIYSLIGAFAYDDPDDISHIKDWTTRYLRELGF